MKKYSFSVSAYVISVFIIGLSLAGYLLATYSLPTTLTSWLMAAAFTLLTAVSTYYILRFGEKIQLSLSTIIYVASLLLFNPATLILVISVGLTLSFLFRTKNDVIQRMFNIGQGLIYTGLGSLVLQLFSTTPWIPINSRAWVGLLVSITAMTLSNFMLVAGVINFQTGRGYRKVLVRVTTSIVSQELVMASLGIIAALLVRSYPWALVLIIIPAVALYYTLKRDREVEEKQADLLVQNSNLVGSLQEQTYQLQKAIGDLETALTDNKEVNLSLEREISQRKQAERDLTAAYDAMLEGLSHALELRDQETEGHSERVTVLTLELAHRMGMSDESQGIIRRGALLHDIGKIGIPDAILLKPARLDPHEWEIMMRHPAYAYSLLYPIEFLRPALDIPYCHHEKWDGTGYPRQLEGEDIPLAARIFAVADVWDALRSDRPYRPAWDDERAREYIASESGKHFDPDVVQAFLCYLDNCANAPIPISLRPYDRQRRPAVHPRTME